MRNNATALERELRRKDRALAEAAAILVLKKNAALVRRGGVAPPPFDRARAREDDRLPPTVPILGG